MDLPFISLFIRRYLRQWKAKDLIFAYEASAERLGKHHCKIIVDLDLTQKQTTQGIVEGYDRTVRR